MFLVQHIVIVIGLIFGSITDIKTREVPDWINFSLIGIGVLLSVFEALFENSFIPFFSALAGLLLGVIIGYVMFYAGQWGGGDSKLIMGLGALFGLWFSGGLSVYSLPPFVIFIINSMLVGAIYGLFWAVIMLFLHFSAFKKSFLEVLHQDFIKKIRIVVYVIILISVILIFLINILLVKLLLIFVAGVSFLMIYLYAFTKAVENSCMIKKIPVSKLTEGDWVSKEIIVNKKLIASPKDLGVSKEQIAKLKKLNVKSIWVKEGIPFVPSFLFAYILTVVLGNWFVWFV